MKRRIVFYILVANALLAGLYLVTDDPPARATFHLVLVVALDRALDRL